MPFMRYERFRFSNRTPDDATDVKGVGIKGDAMDMVDLAAVAKGTIKEGEAAKKDVKATQLRVQGKIGGKARSAMFTAASPRFFEEVLAALRKAGDKYFVRICGIYDDDSSFLLDEAEFKEVAADKGSEAPPKRA